MCGTQTTTIIKFIYFNNFSLIENIGCIMIEIKPHTNGDFKVIKVKERLIEVTGEDSPQTLYIPYGHIEQIVFIGSLEKCIKLKEIIE